jgi:hypothetical protein
MLNDSIQTLSRVRADLESRTDVVGFVENDNAVF